MSEEDTQDGLSQASDFEVRVGDALYAPADKVAGFCENMRHPNAPESFNIEILKRLQRWSLLDENVDLPAAAKDYSMFGDLLWQARNAARGGSQDFLKAFNEDPWDFEEGIEGEYAEMELDDKFPMAKDLKGAIKDERLRFLFRVEPGSVCIKLVIREDGRRQAIRAIETDRSVEEINVDAKKAPAIVPPFEAVELPNNKVSLLISWVEGRVPTASEKELCLERAGELLTVPCEDYDLWGGNFLVSDRIDQTGRPVIYYVDKDIPEAIAQRGYGEISHERLVAFEEERKRASEFWGRS